MLGIIFAVLPRMIDAGHINPTALADKPFIDLAFPDLPGLSTIDLGQEVFNQEKGIIHHLAFSNIALDLIRIEDLLLPIQDLQEEAERLGVVLGIHGTRNTSRELGTSGLATFAEVHSYAFPVGILLQFTSIVCQGLPVRFPKLKLAFLEIGATWLPYYLDRLDEHWEKRAEFEMPLLKKKPSDIVRESKMYFSVEPGESQLAATVDYVGADHFLYASDIPHWDNEFPHNLRDLQGHKQLSNETKEKILYKNAKDLFAL